MQIFQHQSDITYHMMCYQGFTVLNYIDDFVGVRTPNVMCCSYDALLILLQQLGLEISINNLVYPGMKVMCLGIDFVTVECTLSGSQTASDYL